MSPIKPPKVRAIAQRQLEEQAFEAVARELGAGIRREGLWAKAFADADGDPERARSLYLKYRAQSLVDEAFLSANRPPVTEWETQLRADEPEEVQELRAGIDELTRLLDGEIPTWEELYLEVESERDAMQALLDGIFSGAHGLDAIVSLSLCPSCSKQTIQRTGQCAVCREPATSA